MILTLGMLCASRYEFSIDNRQRRFSRTEEKNFPGSGRRRAISSRVARNDLEAREAPMRFSILHGDPLFDNRYHRKEIKRRVTLPNFAVRSLNLAVRFPARYNPSGRLSRRATKQC